MNAVPFAAPRVRASVADGPRFHVRFDRGRGLLSLADEHVVGPVVLTRLSLTLGRVRFPISLNGGALRFRTRQTSVDEIEMRADLRKLLALAEARGVRLRVYGVKNGRFSCALLEENVVVAFEATPVALDGDLALVIENERRVADDAVSAWQRIARAMTVLSGSFDEMRGVFVWKRAARLLLSHALCRYGWRLPDERALHLEVADSNERVLLIKNVTAGARPTDASLLEEARVFSKARAWLAQGETTRGLLAFSELPDESRFAATRTNYASRVALDVGDESARTAEHTPDLALRLAVRAHDADAAANAALALDASELSHELAAHALSLAASVQPDARRAVRAELLERACARVPRDAAVARDAVLAVAELGDAVSVDRIAKRALSSVENREARVTVLASAGAALVALGSRDAARELWKEAVRLDPENALLWKELGDLDAENDPSSALLAYERAASAFASEERFDAAALAYGDAAAMLGRLGRNDSALARIENALELDPSNVRWHVESAIRHAERGARSEARRAFNEVLRFAASEDAQSALAYAVEFHLAERDVAAARVFIDAMARGRGETPEILDYQARLNRVIAESWMHVASRVGELDGDALSDLANDVEDPREAAESLLSSLSTKTTITDDATKSLIAAALIAAARSHDAELLARVTRALAEHVQAFDDVRLIERAEVYADDATTRAQLATRAADLHRSRGAMGAAALAMGRAAFARNDAAAIRGAIETAARASAWADAIDLIESALTLVGDGPARAALLERREELASQLRASRD